MLICIPQLYGIFCGFYSCQLATDDLLPNLWTQVRGLDRYRNAFVQIRKVLLKPFRTLKGLDGRAKTLAEFSGVREVIQLIYGAVIGSEGREASIESIFLRPGLGALLSLFVGIIKAISPSEAWSRDVLESLNVMGFKRQTPMFWVSPFPVCGCGIRESKEGVIEVGSSCGPDLTAELRFARLPNMHISRCVLSLVPEGLPPEEGVPIFYTPVVGQDNLVITGDNPEEDWGVLYSSNPTTGLSAVDRGLLFLMTMFNIRPHGFLIPLDLINVASALAPTEAWVLKDYSTGDPSSWQTYTLLNAYQLRNCRGDLVISRSNGRYELVDASVYPSPQGVSPAFAFFDETLKEIPTYLNRSSAGVAVSNKDGPCPFRVSPSLLTKPCHSKSDTLSTFAKLDRPSKDDIVTLLTALGRSSCEVCSCNGDSCPVFCSLNLTCQLFLDESLVWRDYSTESVSIDFYGLDTSLLKDGSGISQTSIERLVLKRANGLLMRLSHFRAQLDSQSPPHSFATVRRVSFRDSAYMVLPSIKSQIITKDGTWPMTRSGLVFIMVDDGKSTRYTPSRFGHVYPLPQVIVLKDLDLVAYCPDGSGLQFGQVVRPDYQGKMWIPFRGMNDEDVLHQQTVNGRVVPITQNLIPSWIAYAVKNDPEFHQAPNQSLDRMADQLYFGMSSFWVHFRLGDLGRVRGFRVSQSPHYAFVSGPVRRANGRELPELFVRYPYDEKVRVDFNQPTLVVRPMCSIPTAVANQLALSLRRGGLTFRCPCTFHSQTKFIDVTTDEDETITGKIKKWHESNGILNCDHYRYLGGIRTDTFGSLEVSEFRENDSLRQLCQTFRLFIKANGSFAVRLRQNIGAHWMALAPLNTEVDEASQNVLYVQHNPTRASPAFQRVSQNDRLCITKLFAPITNGGSNTIMNLENLTVHIGPLLTEALWYLLLSGSVLNTLINGREYSDEVKTAIVCIFGRVITVSATVRDQYSTLLDFMNNFSRGVGVAGLDYMSGHTNTQICLATARDDQNGCDLRSPLPSAVLFPFSEEHTTPFFSTLRRGIKKGPWKDNASDSKFNDLVRFWSHASMAIPSFRGMLNNSGFSMFFDQSLKGFTSSAGGDLLSGANAIFGPVYER
uniref:Uncharacterized protein n=1 Tax=viral metagenome TaxID=1070528 RepID=A0A2V0RK28_9ZZZZ